MRKARLVKTFKKKFGENVGYSDHTMGIEAAIASVPLGAKIIEKHFTLDKDLLGPDHWFSVNPYELSELIKSVQYAFQARGRGFAQERNDLIQREIMRRRIIFARNLPRGHSINIKDLRFRRASKGIFPSRIYEVVGKKLNVDVKDGDF